MDTLVRPNYILKPHEQLHAAHPHGKTRPIYLDDKSWFQSLFIQFNSIQFNSIQFVE